MKGVCLFSGGTDSAVSAYLLSKKIDLVLLSLDINPGSPEKLKHLESIAEKLGLSLYSAPYHWVQKKITDAVKRRYTCVICKRTMLRVAEKFCKKIDGDLVVTGESLGQVASQTLDNLIVLDSAIDLQILRPLLGWNKEEIIKKAKQIGTYEASTVESLSCGVTPEAPATSAELERVEEEEEELELQGIIKEVSRKIELRWKK